MRTGENEGHSSLLNEQERDKQYNGKEGVGKEAVSENIIYKKQSNMTNNITKENNNAIRRHRHFPWKQIKDGSKEGLVWSDYFTSLLKNSLATVWRKDDANGEKMVQREKYQAQQLLVKHNRTGSHQILK